VIVDGHHHIWRQSDLPWLQGPMVPRIFGPYEPIRRDYDIEEFRRDAESAGIERSVYVQTNWAPDHAVEEVAWVDQVARDHGWPHAVVGFLDLSRDDAGDTLKRALAASSLLVGIRQQLHWHENEQYRFAPRPDLAADPGWQRNLRKVGDAGLLFELQVFPEQFHGAEALLADHRGITFVLVHAGMLEDLSPHGVRQWREGMARLAEHPNLHVKLSGLGTFVRRNDAGHVAMVVRETVGWFGAERCLFGSNFPIEKLWTSYGELLAAHEGALSTLPEPDRAQVLGLTARRLYRIA
jgi:predicted TIM-barrel fold metal-dependent hydrolase